MLLFLCPSIFPLSLSIFSPTEPYCLFHPPYHPSIHPFVVFFVPPSQHCNSPLVFFSLVSLPLSKASSPLISISLASLRFLSRSFSLLTTTTPYIFLSSRHILPIALPEGNLTRLNPQHLILTLYIIIQSITKTSGLRP